MTDPEPIPDVDPDVDPDRLGPERLLAFSDGVVAIALTLLILPLAELVPETAGPEATGLTVLRENLAPIGSFLLSFLVIGRFWAAHHRVFARARTASRALVQWNLAWLLTIVVLPFPTEMVGAYSEDPFTLRFYVGTLLVSAALLSWMTVLISRALGPAARAGLRDMSFGGTTLALVVVFAVTLVAPGLGYWPILLLFLSPVLDRLLRPLTRRVLTGSAGR
ncbi:TMEM175 family protein [Actinomycetospora chibensis]|uniref:TMEM175 family protein n=1 Tax=Actinomycetospora chibensis TaxID=663606 RepID=A0ABV9RR69_9PSEU|nr:TMEM175 family protein [Actinomycetospora chibensis]MDD7927072.1 TMEM175 family protein [Actinomycetospora chibensis]